MEPANHTTMTTTDNIILELGYSGNRSAAAEEASVTDAATTVSDSKRGCKHMACRACSVVDIPGFLFILLNLWDAGLDVGFCYDLANKGHGSYAAVLGCASIFCCLWKVCVDVKHWNSTGMERLARVVKGQLFVFFLEDVTTIYVFLRLPEMYESNVLVKANLIYTSISCGIIALMVFLPLVCLFGYLIFCVFCADPKGGLCGDDGDEDWEGLCGDGEDGAQACAFWFFLIGFTIAAGFVFTIGVMGYLATFHLALGFAASGVVLELLLEVAFGIAMACAAFIVLFDIYECVVGSIYRQ